MSAISEKLGVEESALTNWVQACCNKPDTLAQTNSAEQKIEEALARGAVKIAIERHSGVYQSVYTPFGQMFTLEGKDLTAVPYVIGIGGAIINSAPSNFAVYSGDDETAVELILLGGKGDISVTANVAPAEVARMNTLALEGRAEEARALNQQLMSLHQAMFVEANPIPVKWALTQMGKIPSGIRLPLTVLSEGKQDAVRQALANANLV